jgi:hypothetical protein
MLKTASMDSTHSVDSSSGEEEVASNGFIPFDPKHRWNVEIELIPYPNGEDNSKTISVRTLRECPAQHLADCLKIHLGTDQKIALFTLKLVVNKAIFMDVDLNKELSELVRNS